MPIKKDKASANPEARECAHCGVQEGNHGATLRKCVRCKVTSYCSKPCQTAHWKAGHKLQCVRPEERTFQARGAVKPLMDGPGDENEFPIHMWPLACVPRAARTDSGMTPHLREGGNAPRSSP